MNDQKGIRRILRFLSYILVAVIASCVTLFLFADPMDSKISELQSLIRRCYIGEVTDQQLQDGAAAGMIGATGDRWSYYIPASEYDAYMEQMKNEYVGIGVTIASQMTDAGFEVLSVEENGGAFEAGIQAGDVICQVEGQDVLTLEADAAKQLIRGDADTKVALTVLRGGEKLVFDVMRKRIQVVVAKGELLPEGIGLITIENFDERCADETIAQIETLTQQGAKALIFDVRFNPGGYKTELEEILDYLLPEGPIFRSISYTGEEEVSQSDEACLELPMAVLINADSYSAAEFFAAALSEYDKAVVVGEATTGKSYFQNTFRLSDGSAVGLSVGKYCTPKGVSLAEVGGLKPDVEVLLEEETLTKLYAGILAHEEDLQLQAAIRALQ